MQTNHPKIDITHNGRYVASTTWASNCAVAKERWIDAQKLAGKIIIDRSKVKANYAK
jgi:hypothetical protein